MSFQRMVLIPEGEYFSHNSHPPATALPADQSHRLQSYYFERKLEMPLKPDEDTEVIDEAILNSPRQYVSRATRLLKWLKAKKPLIAWLSNGEVFTPNTHLTGTNIVDLIVYSVSDVRRKVVPAGWKSFLNIMRELHVPKLLVSTKTANELAPEANIEAETETKSTKAMITPRKRKRRIISTPKWHKSY
jgi:hypothetical protein